MAHHRQVMADEDIGHVQLLLELGHQIDNLGLDGHVQGGDNLVADDEFGAQGQGPGDGDPLALAAGELVGEAGGHLGIQPPPG